MRSFIIFLVGAVIAIGAVSYAMVLMDVPRVWIGVAAAVIVGLAIASGASMTRSNTSNTSPNAPANPPANPPATTTTETRRD